MTADLHDYLDIKRRHTAEPQPKRRFALVAFSDIRMTGERNYLVKGLIPSEGLAIVWGPPKCGKTFWVFDIAMHVALGREYRGRRVSPGRVVYIACEGERGLAARTEAFRREHMRPDDPSPQFFLLTTRLDLVAEAGQLIGDIREQIGDGDCAAIVIDTLNRSLVGSESSDEDMASYIKAADALREAFGCAVVIVHHCGIDDKRPRGHTSLAGAADAQISVKREADDTIVATLDFAKDMESGAEVRSTLRVVELDADEDGEPVTSCVIEAIGGGARTAPRRSHKPPSPKAKAFHGALLDALVSAGKPRTEAGGRQSATMDQWKAECCRLGLIDPKSPDNRQRALISKYRLELVSTGWAACNGDFAWSISMVAEAVAP